MAERSDALVRVLPSRRPGDARRSLQSARPARPPGALPRELTGFVGRQQELAAITALLKSDTRLITLTGIGGVGKTRLATRVAELLQADYADGVCLITLAHLPETGEVAAAALAALGLRQRPSKTAADTLAHGLEDEQLLLVLDNCEHVVQASADLVDRLLRQCPGLHILATSREALGVPGERVFRVQPLTLPGGGAGLAALERSDAIQLFVERARFADPTFRLTEGLAPAADRIRPLFGGRTRTTDSGTRIEDASVAAVDRICRLVDGIPLAIELAAARTTTMSVVEIADRLTDPLALLTVGPRTAPARQRTLRAAIDWSYGLLTEQERRLLCRLAVFNGGCTLDAARAVCTEADLPSDALPDVLDRLVSKSLVIVRKDDHATRFTLLGTLRRYLLGYLAQEGEEDAMRGRHRDWCIELAERVRPEWFDHDQMLRLAGEQDNILVALRWTIGTDQAQAAGRLAVGLAPLWVLRGHFAEGRAQLMAAADLPAADASPVLMSTAYSWAALLSYNEGAYTAAEDLAMRALELAETAGDRFAMTAALCQAGQAALGLGELARAAARFEAGVEHADSGSPLAIVNGFQLAEVLFELGSGDRAAEQLARADRWALDAKYHFAKGRLLATRALMAERAGDRAQADRLLTEAVTSERALGAVPGLIEVLIIAGTIQTDRGDYAQAAESLGEALASAASHAASIRLAQVLEAISGLVAHRHPETCVRMAAAAHDLRDAQRALPRPSERRRLAMHLRQARRRLGESGYAAVWKATSTTHLDAVVDEGHALLRQFSGAQVADAPPALPRSELLSDREREVTMLVMRGLSNREIGEELVITRKTAEAHIGHILSKLGLTNRVQIATWGHERRLAQPEPDAPPGS